MSGPISGGGFPKPPPKKESESAKNAENLENVKNIEVNGEEEVAPKKDEE